MKILSLFDGLSCGRIALERIGVKVDRYYASEIDKYAQIVSKANWPDNVYIGDVRNVDVSALDPIEILIGGSPCQSFSFAGKRKGMVTKDEIEILSLEHYLELKEQQFEFEGQSYLFWEYIRVLKDIQKYNPNVFFLLENVLMSQKWEEVITKAIGIDPIMINSALVSAQSRKRNYWSNINAIEEGFFNVLTCKIPQPADKGILLKHILQPESEVDEKYYLSKKALDGILKHLEKQKENGNGFGVKFHEEEGKMSSLKIGGKGVDDIVKISKQGDIKSNQDKAITFTAGAHSGGNHSDMDLICVAMRGRNPENPTSREVGLHTEQVLEPREDGKTNCLTTVQKDNLVLGCDYRSDEGIRVRSNAKSVPLLAKGSNFSSCGQMVLKDFRIRRLTPIECEALQCVPRDYTNHVSSSQRYKMLGNGWNVDTVAHIFSFLPKHFF